MDRDQALTSCRALPGATEGFPFGDTAAVFKVGGKMFAIVPVGADSASISLKCEPNYASALREQYPAVSAGYHLNKRHWNTVTLDGSVDDELLREWVRDSYDLAVAGLTRAQRGALA